MEDQRQGLRLPRQELIVSAGCELAARLNS